MKYRLIAFFAAFVLLSNFTLLPASAAETANVKRAKSDQLVAMLPAADAVATIDIKRMFGEALPLFLSSKQAMLADVTAKVEEMRVKTGIDIRQFDLMAAGVTFTPKAEKKISTDAVVIARGNVNTAQIITAAKTAAKDKYKEETLAGRSIYIFSAKDAAAAGRDAVTGTKPSNHINKMIDKISGEIALTALDSNTVAFGDADLVRGTVEGTTRMSADIISLLHKKPCAVANFAGKVPPGMSAFLPMEQDDLTDSINSIKYGFGNMDTTGGVLAMSVTARTDQEANATQLYDTLEVLQAFGKMALGASKRPDQQLYARLIENLTLGRTGTDVSMDLRVPQTDVDALMAILVK
ncbi:MAG TPA: hypothetical protein VK918_07550 [Pyrinomonadaceae bacterium]|nr:hypothetical protein [Pyrinomonadaceae bacterium]